MKFESIKAGTTLIDEHRYRVGNAKMKRLGAWPVRIISIDAEERSAIVRWNGNAERVMYERGLTKLRAFHSAAYLREHRGVGDDPYNNAAHYPRRKRSEAPRV